MKAKALQTFGVLPLWGTFLTLVLSFIPQRGAMAITRGRECIH